MILPLATTAQVEEALEQWIEETDDTEAAADWSDLFLQLRAEPVNINDTHTVSSLPFISPFQAKALSYYITLHGQLLSLKELNFVPGFDSNIIELMEGITIVAPFEQPRRWR